VSCGTSFFCLFVDPPLSGRKQGGYPYWIAAGCVNINEGRGVATVSRLTGVPDQGTGDYGCQVFVNKAHDPGDTISENKPFVCEKEEEGYRFNFALIY